MGKRRGNLLRSTLLRFSVIAVPLALVSGVAVLACSDDDSASSFRAPEAAGAPGPGSGPSTSFNSSDGGSSDNAVPIGSPLCAVAEGQCFPDDDGKTSPAYNTAACAETPEDIDGGALEEPARACRIVEHEGKYVPRCEPASADRYGVDGVSCSTSSDCAPGFDCVDGEKGPVCRHYCCAGTCEGQTSQNGGATFCDVQALVDYRHHGVKAPVCMPVKTCKLLRDGECTDDETCAVINRKGDTGCVARGPAKTGESCDTDHCASGLTCLGSPGDRRCYQLCRVDGADCGPMQTCTTGSVFQDTTYGVCKDD